ncbi:unnamed protein product [Acanthoscelides obtectus]|uniref:non-specific serine/threonine protein kinase n=1 Tax=Acanthoscelides obtectus TaxID=200917 RepID=A0A9P0P8C9_ACAOB|nr:unnamed protein product [Acanthoscelides obtectus]CAK1632333.1 Serine/threonine-protein kinase mos [Acanthoscelides obtectus]
MLNPSVVRPQIKITQCASVTSIGTKNDFIINRKNAEDICRNGVNNDKRLVVLGKGGFGTVVRGVFKGHTVALKVSRGDMGLPGEDNAVNLDHPNVVKTLHVPKTEEEEYHFRLIIMEYFPNCQQLLSLIEDSKFNMDANLLKFSKDIVDGLWFCHRNGVLHLDLKPQNVLVCDGVCKICDFGSSRRPNHERGFIYQGTLIYAAPELLMGCWPTEKCDIYSLGITFWQMKSRKSPYSEYENMETIIYKVVKFNLRPEENTPDLNYAKLYQRCWSRDPDDRPTSFEVIKNLLKDCF